jgi:hypothetical protein
MNYFKSFHLFLMPLVFLTTCRFPNFYADPDDQGLSRFTSRGYNVASVYINERPFKNEAPDYPYLRKDASGNTMDTLEFQWRLYPNDNTAIVNADYHTISFRMPVPESFNKNSLLAFNGQRFLNAVPVTLQDSSQKIIAGIATLYFVSVSETVSPSNQKYIKLSGLFDGNIGDSVLITKGRFDFQIDETRLNF